MKRIAGLIRLVTVWYWTRRDARDERWLEELRPYL